MRGNQGGHTEVGAVRQSGDEPGGHQCAVVLGEHGGGVAHGERDHQGNQQSAP